ncbi:hypothetical protein [Alloyangia pacifica]|uniref:D-galactarate dehydratase n=1 Tax=Alloyangia pacifica TaxID=311180 RepID=A0A1I6PTJ8_9RHOB|nr:hypothetical protein [Alloyangia pacifica]SDG35288.1 hypothetical protein SAMN04488245_102456 [Alloyangia pacifica]SFS43534.1 hypothetical protein SAMN04488050_101757 [Alloyangia pacifica]
MRVIASLPALALPALLAACAQQSTGVATPQPAPTSASGGTTLRPPANARTEEQFDTTSAEERAAAASAPASSERQLGSTVASLGDPAEPGFWLETPMVSSVTKGRVVYPATGKSAQVELRPIEGPASGGSRISLAAMRLIGAPLTDLPTLTVYAGGASG